MESNLIIKIENLLREINVSENTLAKLDDYFDGEIEDGFLCGLPEVNPYNQRNDYLRDFADVYKQIEASKNGLELKKLADMLFEIFKDRMSKIIKICDCYGVKYRLQKLEDYNLCRKKIICIYIDYLVKEFSIYPNDYKWLTDRLDLLDNREQNSIIRNLEISVQKGIADSKALFLMYSLYCSNNDADEMTEEYLSNIERMLIDLISSPNLHYIDSLDKDAVINFLCSESNYDENKGKVIINNLRKNVGIGESYKCVINGSAFLNADKSILCKNYVRFIVQYNFKITLNNINNLLSEEMILNSAQKIGIPIKYVIAWYVSKHSYDEYFKEKYIEDADGFKKGVKLSNLKEQNYLIQFLLEDDEKEEFIEIVNKSCVDEIKKILELKNISSHVIIQCEEFLKGEKDFKEIEKDLYSVKNKADFYRDNSHILDNTFKTLIKIENCPIFKRAAVLLTSIRENGYIYSIYKFSIENIEKFIELFEEYGMDIQYIMSFLGSYKIYKGDCNNVESAAKNLIEKKREDVIKNIKNVEPETRINFLYMFEKENTKSGIKIFLDNFNDKSEAVKEYIITLLEYKTEYMDMIIEKTLSKKQNERELSIKILKSWLKKKEISKEKKEKILISLKNVLLKEKTNKIKELFKDIDELKDSVEEIVVDKVMDPHEIVKKSLRARNINSLSWLKFDTLLKVRLKDENKYCDEDILKAIIFIYRSQKEICRNKEADILLHMLNTDDLKNFAELVFKRWSEYDFNIKEKWVLPFTCLYGGQIGINSIKNEIKNWYKNNKIILAQYGLSALSLIRTKEMFMYFYNYEAGCNSSAIKSANNAILVNLAEEFEIAYDELFIKVYLDKNEEMELNYGDRRFKVCINDRASLDIFNESGKKVRGIPKPQENNEQQIKEYKKYEQLKKDLKKTIKNHLWSLNNKRGMLWRAYYKEEWKRLFINSPILKRLSWGIIWGVYEEDSLIDTFMCMEDGTFNNINDEEFDFKGCLNENRLIKAINKKELSEEKIALWEKQISDYEINKIVKQLE